MAGGGVYVDVDTETDANVPKIESPEKVKKKRKRLPKVQQKRKSKRKSKKRRRSDSESSSSAPKPRRKKLKGQRSRRASRKPSSKRRRSKKRRRSTPESAKESPRKKRRNNHQRDSKRDKRKNKKSKRGHLAVDFTIDGGPGNAPIDVYLCLTHQEIDIGIERLRTEDQRVVGLDCEWNNHFIERQAKVALTQIGSTRVVLLIPMLHHKRRFPDSLVDYLLDESVIKTGIGIRGDVTRLEKDHGLTVQGVADIKDYKSLGVDCFGYGSKRSLEYLATKQGHESWKTSDQMSKWSRTELRMSQKVYAAKDAIYSARILWGLYFQEITYEAPDQLPDDFHEWLERPLKLRAEAARMKEARREARRAAAEAKKDAKAKRAAAKEAKKEDKAKNLDRFRMMLNNSKKKKSKKKK